MNDNGDPDRGLALALANAVLIRELLDTLAKRGLLGAPERAELLAQARHTLVELTEAEAFPADVLTGAFNAIGLFTTPDPDQGSPPPRR